jgi:hypothetical protein
MASPPARIHSLETRRAQRKAFFCFSLRRRKAKNPLPGGSPHRHRSSFSLAIRTLLNLTLPTLCVCHEPSLFMFSGVSAENIKKNRLCALRVLAVNRISERIPRRFCLPPVVLPVGSASAARAAGLASVYLKCCHPYGEASPQLAAGRLQYLFLHC